MKSGLLFAIAAFAGLSAGAQRTAPDTISLSDGSLIIQPINHATMVLTATGKTIYVDPVGGAAKFQGLASPDVILVTDIHGDHFDPGTLRELIKTGVTLIAPEAVANKIGDFPKGGNVVV